jgi:hypothetical protein
MIKSFPVFHLFFLTEFMMNEQRAMSLNEWDFFYDNDKNHWALIGVL